MHVIEEIVNEAFAAAKHATENCIAANPDVWYPCGFAWVIIRPARGPLVTFLKKAKIGDKGVYSGWQIWNPSGHNTQWMDAKYYGAQAFAEVLKRHGYNCTPYSRMD